MKREISTKKSKGIFTFPNLVFFTIMIYPVLDFILVAYYTRIMDQIGTIILLYGFEALVFLLGLVVYLKMGKMTDKIFYYPIMIVIIWALYSIIGYRYYPNMFVLLKSLRYMFVPLVLMFFGMYLSYVNYSMSRIIKFILIFSVIACLWGCIELFVLNAKGTSNDFWNNNLYFAQYYVDIKGHEDLAEGKDPFGVGAGSRGMFWVLGAQHRMLSFFIEPLSCGIYLSGALTLVFYLMILKQNIYTRYLPIFFVIILCGVLLTQSRSAILFFVMSMTPIVVKSKRGRVYFFVFALLAFVILGYAGVTQTFRFDAGLDALANKEGGHAHGIINFYTELFMPSFWIGHGVGFIYTQESSYAFIYEQTGYLGLITFLMMMKKFYYMANKLDIRYRLYSYLTKGYILAILLLMNFGNYIYSFKSFMFIWPFIGYTVMLRRKVEIANLAAKKHKMKQIMIAPTPIVLAQPLSPASNII